jgi:hypothetical protein
MAHHTLSSGIEGFIQLAMARFLPPADAVEQDSILETGYGQNRPFQLTMDLALSGVVIQMYGVFDA